MVSTHWLAATFLTEPMLPSHAQEKPQNRLYSLATPVA